MTDRTWSPRRPLVGKSNWMPALAHLHQCLAGPCTRWWCGRPACGNAAQWCPSAGWGGGRFSASLLARSRSRRRIRLEVMVAAGMIFSFFKKKENRARTPLAVWRRRGKRWRGMVRVVRDGQAEDHTHNSVR